MSETHGQKRQNEDADEEQQVKRVRYEYDYNDLISILVGEEEQAFSVHKDSICERSKFFEAAVSTDRWREGKEKLVRLPDIDVDDFRTYVHWVYTGKVMAEVKFKSADTNAARELITHIDMYIVADVLDDGELREHVLENLIAEFPARKPPHPDWCTIIWEQTPKGSPLRIFLVAWIWNNLHPEDFSGSASAFPTEFLEEFAVHAMSRKTERLEVGAFQDKMRRKLLSNM